MYSSVTFQDLVQWTQGKLTPSDSPKIAVKRLSTDTRTLKGGDVFLALRGENFNGNLYLKEAEKAGASAVICEVEERLGIPTLVVGDSLKALVRIAEKLRDRFSGPVFAITGSAGKSSTKDMVATLLGKNTVSSPASFNNLLGVSRTLCLLEDSTESLVLEMGMNNPGEIREMCGVFKPEIGLISNIGDAHIGKLGGQEGVYLAKKELFDFLSGNKKTRGVALNLDDILVVSAYEKAFNEALRKTIPVLTYSMENADADIYLRHRTVDPKTGFLKIEVEVADKIIATELPIYGEHHAENIAAAIAMVRLAGVSVSDIELRIRDVRPAYHRGEVHSLKQECVLIDESYNSNPRALLSSLETLRKLDGKRRRVLVLGEMRELGEFSEALHAEVGEYLVECFRESGTPFLLLTVQGHAKKIQEVVQQQIPTLPTFHVEKVAEAAKLLPGLLKPQDIILIKGSRGVALDLLLPHLQ